MTRVKNFLTGLVPWQRYGTLIGCALVLLVIGYMLVQGKAAWDIWRAGIHPAKQAEQKAAGELQQGKGALDQSTAETKRVLQEYAIAQEAVRNLSQQVSRERQTADQLRARLDALEAQSKATPRPTTLQEAHDALAHSRSVYR